MSFFNPWLWCGLGAVAAPVWLHLRRRVEKHAKAFPGLRFLEPAPVTQRSPLSLRDLLLLLLRLLAVMLVTAGLSWPYISDSNAAAVSTSRVYILDNTFSVQAGGGFAQNRDFTAREIGRLPETTQVAVVELRSNAATVVGFGETRENAQKIVSGLEASNQRGAYIGAFREAQALLDRSIGQRREIVFLGDNQVNQWEENSGGLGFLHGVDVSFGRPFGPAMRDNVSIHVNGVRRIFRGDHAQLQCNALIQHTDKPGKGDVVIEVNGKELLRKSMDFNGMSESHPVAGLWEGHPTEWIEGRMLIEHESDALKLDDTAWFAASPVIEGKVAVLARSQFLHAALSTEVMRGHWQKQTIDAAKVEELESSDADVLVLEASFLQSGVVRSAVERFLANERGVFIQVDRISPIVSEALRKLGFVVKEQPGGETSEPIWKFLATHRALAPFTSPDFGNLFGINVVARFHLEPTLGSGLAFLRGGDVVLADGIQGGGRVLVSAFAFSREQTNWVVDPSFVPFLDLSLQHLRQDTDKVAFLEPGELWTVVLRVEEKVSRLVLRQKDKVLSEVEVGPDRKANVKAPGSPGLYQLTFDGDPEPKRMLAVNTRPEESQLVYETKRPDSLASWTSGTGVEQNVERRPEPSAIAGVARLQLVWWWLVLAGFVLAGLETLFVGIRRRFLL